MKSVFDKSTREELLKRISSLDENNVAQWGKMSVSQMMKHCSKWDEMALGKKRYERTFLGKLFGKFALKAMMKDEPMKKNLPTVPAFKINGKVDFLEQKMKWLKLVDDYGQFSSEGCMHPFFGRLTKEQAGYIGYKHTDHHLRQFNR